MNHLPNGTIAVGAPGSEARKRCELEDAAKATRNEQGQFLPSGKPVATITQTTKKDGALSGNYFVLNMNGREMGGTSYTALAGYARRQGFTVVKADA